MGLKNSFSIEIPDLSESKLASFGRPLTRTLYRRLSSELGSSSFLFNSPLFVKSNKPDEERLWCFHKPVGAITTAKDEKNRKTIYDYFPSNLPRVMPVGRLDLNSEGLLLLTNSGELKRKLELPSSELSRLYRVRVKGRPKEASLDSLRSGISIEKEFFRPMQISVDRQQGANAWLTIELREGKNREIRRAMGELGLQVNRLLRIEYGPFKLGSLKRGEISEINSKSVRRSLKTVNIDLEKANNNKRNQNKYSKVSRKLN
jgi:23S rRNA pseudouridine2605 synthase